MNKNNAFFNATMTWGAVLGIALVVFQLIMYFVNPLSTSSVVQFVTFALIFTIVFYGMKQHRDANLGGFLSYGQGVGFGALTGCFAGIIVGFYSFLLYKFIDPTLIDKMMVLAEEQMLAQNPNMSDEELEMALSISQKMTSPFFLLIFSAIGIAFWSTLISLIVAAIHKRKDTSWNSNFEQ